MNTVNQETLDLIKRFEGLRLTAYQDAVGVWTIGYGTTAGAGIGIEPRAGMRITEAQAESYLRQTVEAFAVQVADLIKVPVTDNQFGACVSLAYNIGPGAFAKSSVLRKLNEGDYAGAASAFALWNKAGGKVLQGLVTRRAAEAALFLKGETDGKKIHQAEVPDVVDGGGHASVWRADGGGGWMAILAAIGAFLARILGNGRGGTGNGGADGNRP